MNANLQGSEQIHPNPPPSLSVTGEILLACICLFFSILSYLFFSYLAKLFGDLGRDKIKMYIIVFAFLVSGGQLLYFYKTSQNIEKIKLMHYSCKLGEEVVILPSETLETDNLKYKVMKHIDDDGAPIDTKYICD